MEAGWRVATKPLKNTQFRRLFVSNLAFFLAMTGQGVVRGWLALLLTNDELAVGLVSAAFGAPMLLLSPHSGVLADRVDRRNLIVLSQLIAVLAESAILVLMVLDRLEFWHLVAGAGVLGCALPLSMPARQAIVVNIVGMRSLSAAVALNMSGTNVTRILGPAISGFLIAVLSTEGVYAVNVGIYLLALLALMRVNRVPPADSSKDESVYKNLLEGFAYMRSNRLVLILLVYGLVPMFLAMPFQALLPFFAENVWETGSVGLGLLSAASGAGAFAGSIWVAARNPNAGRLRAMMISVLGFGVLLAAFALSPWFYVALVLVFLANIGASVFGTLNNTAIQLVIPDRVRGRISSFLMMSLSLPLLGTLPITAAARVVGAPMAVGVSSVLAVLISIAFYFASRELRNLDAHVDRVIGRAHEPT